MEKHSNNAFSPESNLLRKSPRLVTLGSETKSKSRSSPLSIHADSSWDFSLHVVGVKSEQQEDAIPLDSVDPNAMSPRRSSRFTNNKYKGSASGSPVAALPSSAPRTSSSLSLRPNSRKRQLLEENPSGPSGSGTGSNRKKARGYEVDLRLRRSPRLNLSLDEAKGRNSQSSLLGLSLKSMQLGEGQKKTRISNSGSGEKVLRSRKIDLPKTPDDSKSVGYKLLRSRKTELELVKTPDGSTIVGAKLSRSRKLALELANAKTPNDLAKTQNHVRKNISPRRLGNSNAVEKCTGTTEREIELNSRKIELVLTDDLGAVTPANDSVGGRDLNSGESCLMSDEGELEIRDQSAGKCESDLSIEKCSRSRKGEDAATTAAVLNDGNSKTKQSSIKSAKKSGIKAISFFIGEPFTEEEAVKKWQWRYELMSSRSKGNNCVINAGEEDETILNVQFHYAQASVSGCIFSVGDCALIKGEGKQNHIGRILEFFKTRDGEDYFRVQWFYRAEETVMKEAAALLDKKRIFYSTLQNDNPLDCIISKVSIAQVPNTASLKQDDIPPAKFYYDMEYCVEYSTFRNLQFGDSMASHDSVPHQPGDAFHKPISATPLAVLPSCKSLEAELTLLDLFSGCGGMSTGLSLGAKLSSVNLVTRWAVDFEKSATDSVKLNHPEAQVRNESAESFLELLKGWKKLCQWYVFSEPEKTPEAESNNEADGESTENFDLEKDENPDEEYEVSHLVDVCHGDPNDTGKKALHFRVCWKGYGPDEDTWEPIEGLSNCKDKIVDFVRNGLRFKILPLPGDVDVICGGPPCQGISGYNRHRNVDAPLTDEKNHQLVVFMDIVEFLKPKYVLMENVTDILRFGEAALGRYALSRLVHMKYQARLGTIAAGCYGLPQFRLRVFLWGAISSEKLPPFPLPTHEVVVKYWPPLEFERNTVGYDEGQPRKLQDAAILSDAISDLPAVTSNEKLDEMPYGMPPVTEFQRYIRLTKEEMMGITSPQSTATNKPLLYDHRAHAFSEDNCIRASQIPHRKGANFRDLPGVIVGNDKVVRRDPTMEPAVLPSGEPLVPECVFHYEKGKSKRPLGRVWWDETVPTVLTFPYFLAQAILHPEQDRVFTIRECARLQGFPDYYRFCGTVKERYCQVGNAVAIPVGKALGYALGMAYQKLTDDNPLMTLPPNFAFQVPSTDEIVVLGN